MRGRPPGTATSCPSNMNDQETKRSMNYWSFNAVISATESPVT
jgi:hypothetical protein